MTPDTQTILKQLLLSHLVTPKRKILRHKQLNNGGYAMLRACGLSKNQATATNEIVAGHAAKWRDEGHDPTDADMQAVLGQLVSSSD